MANPTSNYGWQMPTATDLVTDLPADFEVFGQAVDTALADLQGGTTGQVLAKNSNTSMDFVWVTSDDANAIQNAIVDAKGDLITATAADTPARLAVGTNGHVLTADSTQSTGLKWAAAGSGAVVQVVSATHSTAVSSTSGTYADTGLTVNITPTSASNKILVMVSQYCYCDNAVSVYEAAVKLRLNRGATAIYNDGKFAWYNYKGGGTNQTTGITVNYVYLDSPATTSSTTYKTQFAFYAGTATVNRDSNTATITVMEVTP